MWTLPVWGAITLGCASTGGQQAAAPVSVAVERAAVDTTALEAPVRIIFDWSVQERDARFQGRGVARAEPPYQARLDLFGPRGEGYLSAALVEDDVRLLPSSQEAPVPPPPLLWSTLGVFRPPAGAELVLSRRDGDRIRLEYRSDRDRWRFELRDGRLRRAEWEPEGAGRHTVELEGESALDLPRRAVYRDWAEFRELILTLDEVEHVEPYPPEVWLPGAR